MEVTPIEAMEVTQNEATEVTSIEEMEVTPNEAMELMPKDTTDASTNDAVESTPSVESPLTGKFLCKREHWLPAIFRTQEINLSLMAGLATPVLIPQLKCSRLNKMDEMFDKFESELADKTQTLPVNDLDPIPTTEDIGDLFKSFKESGELKWPLSLQANDQSHCAETVPYILYSTKPEPQEVVLTYEEEQQLAVTSLLASEKKRSESLAHKEIMLYQQQKQWEREIEEFGHTINEEETAANYLSSKGYTMPTLDDMSAYENQLTSAETQEGQEVMCQKLSSKSVYEVETKIFENEVNEETIIFQHEFKDETMLLTNRVDEEIMLFKHEVDEEDEKGCKDLFEFKIDKDFEDMEVTEIKLEMDEEEVKEEDEQIIQLEDNGISFFDSDSYMDYLWFEEIEVKENEQNTDEHFNELDVSDMVISNDILQQAIDSIALSEEDLYFELTNTEDTNDSNIETQLETDGSEQEEAIQQWLLKCSQDISQNLQAQFDIHNNSLATSETEPLDIEMQIAQISELQTQNIKNDIMPTIDDGQQPESNQNEWQNSYVLGLENFKNVIDENMTELCDPEANQDHSSQSVESESNVSLQDLQRSLLMPALPAFQDPRLQQLRILRPPTQRNAERANLQIDMAYVQAYSILHVDGCLDMLQLAAMLANAVYTAEVQVLHVRFDDAQIAWIWHDGSILIINACNKAILAETQKHLLSKILGDNPSETLAQLNASLSQMIHSTEFPFDICMEDFKKANKTYPLANDTTEDGFKFAYFVDKRIPGVAAKFSENGAVQVFAMDAAQANNMLEKLYMLTAKYRRPKLKTLEQPKQDLPSN